MQGGHHTGAFAHRRRHPFDRPGAHIADDFASGSASADLTLEGLREFEAIREFLYSKMRGIKEHPAAGVVAPDAELAAALRAVAAELRATRLALTARTGSDQDNRHV